MYYLYMVKGIFFTFILILFFIEVSAQHYEISFEWEGLENQSVLVGYHFLGKKYGQDSLHFDKRGKAVLAGKDSLQAGVYFLYTPSYYFEFVVAEQVFGLKGSTQNGYDKLQIEGSVENELFRTFQIRMAELQNQQRKNVETLKTEGLEDSVKLQASIRELNEEMETLRDSLISEDPDGLIGKMLQVMRGVRVPSFDEVGDAQERRKMKGIYYRSYYFDMISYAGELNRTPVFKDYVIKYFDQVVPVIPDSMIVAIDEWLWYCKTDQVSYRYWLQYFLEDYQETEIMGMDKVWIHLIENYCLTGEADWLTEKTLKTLRDEVVFVKPNLIGNKAPGFYAVDTLLRPFVWQNLGADYLVLFFYDPDCGHCKKKTPLLNRNHEKIRSLGGEIVGVCTTTEVDKWKKFIGDYDLKWIHLADPYGRSDFRVKYNTRTTPQLYVLDKDREIIAKKLDPEDQLVEFLKTYQKMQPAK